VDQAALRVADNRAMWMWTSRQDGNGLLAKDDLKTTHPARFRYGIAGSARPQENAAILAAFLMLDVPPWPFEPEDVEEAGNIRASLERAGTPIGPYDVLIAAQVRRRSAIAGDGEQGEFTRVPELRIEDWAVAPRRPTRACALLAFSSPWSNETRVPDFAKRTHR
jgi:predicted nucleic acid-binding protein